jgi:predicted transcriptional regulator
MTAKTEYEFTLVLSFKDGQELDRLMVDALYEAGCDDALVGSSNGEIFVDFTREAPSLLDAISGAIQNIKEADIGAQVARIDDRNWLSQAEMARKVGISRSMMSQYVSGNKGPGGFPAPAGSMRSKGQVWDWSRACLWFRKQNLVSEEVARNAEVIAMINNDLERRAQMRRNPLLAIALSAKMKMIEKLLREKGERKTKVKQPKKPRAKKADGHLVN